jgi:cation diffusion facilitator family transporter
LALTLLGTGISVGVMANRDLLEILASQRAGALSTTIPQIPTFPALVMAGISIVSKEWLFRITRNVGERINSQIVIANAWHHRSDAYSSVLALFSIGLAMAGLVAADAAAGLLVAGMICMTGAEILGESVKQLTDTTDEKLVKRITDIAANTKDIVSVQRVRARQVGSSSVIDLTICIPKTLSSVTEARAIEERLRNRILQEDGVLDVDVKAICADTVATNSQSHAGRQEIIDLNDIVDIATPTIISKAEVEANVRDEILKHYPEVHSIKGITVHYQDIVTNPIDVDVDIMLHDTNGTTIALASQLAENVRNTLELSEQIHKASIFLDLNQMNYQYATRDVQT